MRTALVLLALMCGAVSTIAAEPQKWCSEETPEQIIVTSDHPPAFTIDGKAIRPGIEHTEREDGNDVIVLVYQDRVFWPCEKQ